MSTTVTPGGDARAVFDCKKALEQDSTLQRIDACMDQIMAKFPGHAAQKNRPVTPTGPRYELAAVAPAAPPAAMKPERAATASYAQDSGRHFVNPKDYMSESSSEADMREVNPMDELSDFESEPSSLQTRARVASPAAAPAPRDPLVVQCEEQKARADDDVDMGVEQDEPMREESEDEEDEEEPTACHVCQRSENPRETLLCDNCDEEYHIYCLTPPLAQIPEGEWFCPDCAPARPPASAASTSSAEDANIKTELAAQASISNGASAASEAPATSTGDDGAARRATQTSASSASSGNLASANGGDAPATASSISIMQTLSQDPEASNSLLVHACSCDDARCSSAVFQALCPHMKRFLRSVCWASHSDKWRSYRLAHVTAELFAFHAMHCKLERCNVPLCDKIREEEIV